MGIYIFSFKKNYIYDLIQTTSLSLISTRLYTTSSKKRYTKAERSNIIIESPLNDIIIGLILGDGHLQKRTIKGHTRFMYAQSSLRQHHFNYFNHVLSLFTAYISSDFVLKPRSFVDKKTGKTYGSVNFATLTLPCFDYFRQVFYNSENKKICPLNIKELLTLRGLAYWIMDDGSLQNKGLHLNTYGFTLEEVVNLKNAVENLFAYQSPIKCSIHSHKKGFRIYIWQESMDIVRSQISQFMHEDMLYKINSDIKNIY